MPTTLEAQASTLIAKNAVKYKAMGCTHRVELQCFGLRGGYVETKVFYVKAAPDTAKICALALQAGSRSLSHSIDSAKVSAL